MKCGQTVVMATPGQIGSTEHLWFVITEPHPKDGACVMVSLTTLRDGKDQTVTLGPQDHSFIRHQSAVFYAMPRWVTAETLNGHLANGTIQLHDDCRPDLLKLIQSGLLASPATPKKFIAYCKEAWAPKG